MGHDLTIIDVRNLLLISLYEIDMNIICIIEAQMSYAYLYYLKMNVICLFVLFTHKNHAHDFCVQIMHDIYV
jgi:hypothetical protein